MRTLQRAIAATVALAIVAGAGPVGAKPPMWRVSGAKGEAVLFGSIHLLPTGLAWRTAALTEAVAHADELWFEIPIGGEADQRAAALLQSRGRLPAGDTLANHLAPALLRRLDADAAAVGLQAEALAPMRPWLADATLSVTADAVSGARVSEGVERQINALAPGTAKRRALESAADQIAVLASGTEAEQTALLNVTLDDVEAGPGRYDALIKAWSDGDLTSLRRQALDPLLAASPRAYDALVTVRNRRWAGEIARRLRRRGKIVVVVGVAHLIGPGGLPDLLRAYGFKVEEQR